MDDGNDRNDGNDGNAAQSTPGDAKRVDEFAGISKANSVTGGGRMIGGGNITAFVLDAGNSFASFWFLITSCKYPLSKRSANFKRGDAIPLSTLKKYYLSSEMR